MCCDHQSAGCVVGLATRVGDDRVTQLPARFLVLAPECGAPVSDHEGQVVATQDVATLTPITDSGVWPSATAAGRYGFRGLSTAARR